MKGLAWMSGRQEALTLMSSSSWTMGRSVRGRSSFRLFCSKDCRKMGCSASTPCALLWLLAWHAVGTWSALRVHAGQWQYSIYTGHMHTLHLLLPGEATACCRACRHSPCS